MDGPPSDLDELLQRLDGLLEAQDAERELDPGEGNFNCEDCNACYQCRFCRGCDSCEDCTYCEDCVDCLGCTQSKRSVSCEGCAYLEDCRDCARSRYLVLCLECEDCVHCLACVGLSGEEYCVLNEKVGKKRFYEVAAWVRDELERRAERGWRPEVIGLPTDEEEQEEEAPSLGAAPGGEAPRGPDEIGPPPTWGSDSGRAQQPEEEDPWIRGTPVPGAGGPEPEAPWRDASSARRPAAPRDPRREAAEDADSPWLPAEPVPAPRSEAGRRAAARAYGEGSASGTGERSGASSRHGRDGSMATGSRSSSSLRSGRAPRRARPDAEMRRVMPGPSNPSLPERLPWEESQRVGRNRPAPSVPPGREEGRDRGEGVAEDSLRRGRRPPRRD